MRQLRAHAKVPVLHVDKKIKATSALPLKALFQSMIVNRDREE